MSTVGPRPALLSEVASYNDYQRQRLLVKPGMTCYWQTRRNRDSITFDEWVDLDLSHDVKVRNLRGEPIGSGTFRFDYFDQNYISKLFDKEGEEFNRHLDKKVFDAEMNRLSAAVG